MVDFGSVSQQIIEKQRQINAQRAQLESFNPSIIQTQEQLRRATPQSQIRVRKQELEREAAKSKALNELQQYEQQFQQTTSPVQSAIEQQKEFEIGYKRGVEGESSYGLSKAALEGYYQGETSKGLYSKNAEQLQALKEAGLEPIFSGGEIIGFNDFKNLKSIPLPSFSEPYLTGEPISRIPEAPFTPVPTTSFLNDFSSNISSRLKASENAQSTFSGILSFAPEIKSGYQKAKSFLGEYYPVPSEIKATGLVFNKSAQKVKSYISPDQYSIKGAGDVVGSKKVYDISTGKYYDIPVTRAEKYTEAQKQGDIFVESGLLAAGATPGAFGSFSFFTTPEDITAYRLKNLRAIEKAPISDIEKGQRIALLNREIPAPDYTDLIGKKQSAKLLQERFNVLGGEGFTSPVIELEAGAGAEKLTKAQITAIANDLKTTGVAKNLKEAKKIVREGSVSISGFETKLPESIDLMTGSLGDIKKTVKLPSLSETRPDILSGEYKQVSLRFSDLGKRGQTSLASTYQVSPSGRSTNLRTSIARVPKGGKTGTLSIFEKGRVSRATIKTPTGNFVLENTRPIRRVAEYRVDLRTGRLKKIVSGKDFDVFGREGVITTRKLPTKIERITPKEFLEELNTPVSAKKLRTEKVRGVRVGETKFGEVKVIGKPNKFLEGVKGRKGDIDFFVGRTGKQRNYATFSAKGTRLKAPIVGPEDLFPPVKPSKSPFKTIPKGRKSSRINQLLSQKLISEQITPTNVKIKVPTPKSVKVTQPTRIPTELFGTSVLPFVGTMGTGNIEVISYPSRTRLTEVPLTIQVPKPNLSIKSGVVVKSKENLGNLEKISNITSQINLPRIDLTPKSNQVERTRLLPAQKPISKSRQTFAQLYSVTTPRRIPPERPPTTPKPRIKPVTLTKSKRRRTPFVSSGREGSIYITEFRRKGKFSPKFKSTSLFAATNVGKKLARETLGASFRVKEARTGKFVKLAPSQEFRPSKRDSFILVQKAPARLSSLGERREIKKARRGNFLI